MTPLHELVTFLLAVCKSSKSTQDCSTVRLCWSVGILQFREAQTFLLRTADVTQRYKDLFYEVLRRLPSLLKLLMKNPPPGGGRGRVWTVRQPFSKVVTDGDKRKLLLHLFFIYEREGNKRSSSVVTEKMFLFQSTLPPQSFPATFLSCSFSQVRLSFQFFKPGVSDVIRGPESNITDSLSFS